MYLAGKVQSCILKVLVGTFTALFSTKKEDTNTKKEGTRASETLFSVLIKHVHFHPFLQTFILFLGITCGRLNLNRIKILFCHFTVSDFLHSMGWSTELKAFDFVCVVKKVETILRTHILGRNLTTRLVRNSIYASRYLSFLQLDEMLN